MLLGTRALAVAQLLAVGLPAGLAQLGIDQQPRGGLIQLDGGGRLPRRLPQRGHRPGTLALGLALQHRQPLSQGRLIGFRGGGQRFPFLLLHPRLSQLGLCLRQLFGHLAFGALESGQGFAQLPQLLRQLRIPRRRRLGRLKRAATELRIPEGAVKPHPQLPGHAQDFQGRGVVAVQIVVGQVALAPHPMEQLGHLPLQHAIPLQPPQELLLGFLHPDLHPEPGRHLLGQQLRQLPQLEQGGVGILWEVALRQEAQAKQLLVVAAEVEEVGAHRWPAPGPMEGILFGEGYLSQKVRAVSPFLWPIVSRWRFPPHRSIAAGALSAAAVSTSWPRSVTATSSSMRMPMPFQRSSIAGWPSGTASRSLT